MGEISLVVGGGTPTTSDTSNFENGDIPWVTPADLTGYADKYISHGARYITQRGLIGSGARMLPEGTVLFSSRAPIGYVAIAKKSLCTNQGFKSFILGSGIASEYIYYFLKSAKDLATSLASGTTFLEISGAKAAIIPVPLAPLPEQHRIVAEIERQFSLLDVGVANLKRVQANLKRYRASVLQAACEGRLVPTEAALAQTEGREYEPATMLLARILVERRARWEAEQLAKMEKQGKLPLNGAWKAKYQEPAAPDRSSLPELPMGWGWATVEQSSQYARYGSSAKTTEDIGVPVLRMGNIQNGELDFTQLKYLPETHDEFPNLLLKSGDLLFNRTNSPELVGKTAVYHGHPSPCSYASYLISLRLVDGCSSEYLAYYINSSTGRKWIASVVTQQVGQANVNGTKLQALCFSLPPLAEQERIVAEVERRLSVVDNLEQVVKANLKRAERLRQAILKEAFAGRLVAQDPDDEPASVLLERIKAEREAQARTAAKAGRQKEKQGVLTL